MNFAVLVILLSVLGIAIGANDWSEACLSGSCSFDIEASPSTMGGTIKISGASSAISDITTAAGWQILNCTNNTNSQTIHLACTDESLGCNHLFENGAQDTIVRLPQSCGSGPFVRIADHWIPQDQSNPASAIPRLAKRAALNLQVHALQVDDKFENMLGTHGNVSFTINAQGDHAVNIKAGNGENRRKRQNGGLSVVESADITESVFIISTANLGTCPGLDFSFNDVEIGFDDSPFTFNTILSVSGTVSPPNIETLEFSAPTTADINGFFAAFMSIQGTTPNAQLTLLETDFQGFSLEGIVQIDPAFTLSTFTEAFAEGMANFEGQIDFDFSINSLQFVFPSNSPPATINITHQNSLWQSGPKPAPGSQVVVMSIVSFTHLVNIAAFSKSVQLSVTHLFDIQMVSTAEPVGSSNNEEEVCIQFTFNVQTMITNSGAFFDALPSAEDSQGIFVGEQEFTPADLCQNVALGPSPSISRREKLPLSARAPPSCPPNVAVAEDTVIFQGTFL